LFNCRCVLLLEVSSSLQINIACKDYLQNTKAMWLGLQANDAEMHSHLAAYSVGSCDILLSA